MCVCDLGGVYIKPTRPWVVAPLPSPLATIKRRPVQRPVVHRLSSCPVLPAVAACRPVVLSSAVLCCRRVVSSAVVVCRLSSVLSAWRLRVFASSRLAAASPFSPIFCAIPASLFTLSKLYPLREISASFHSRFNPYFPCPDFTDSMHFLSRK